MPTVQPFPAGGYRFHQPRVPIFWRVAAEPGFRIASARASRDPCRWPTVLMPSKPTSPVSDARRPRFCACELRSPVQFTDTGFVAFNRHYVERLAPWGIFREQGNLVAR